MSHEVSVSPALVSIVARATISPSTRATNIVKGECGSRQWARVSAAS